MQKTVKGPLKGQRTLAFLNRGPHTYRQVDVTFVQGEKGELATREFGDRYWSRTRQAGQSGAAKSSLLDW